MLQKLENNKRNQNREVWKIGKVAVVIVAVFAVVVKFYDNVIRSGEILD